MSSLLNATAEVAALAGARALKYWRSDLDVERKADGSPVTRADREGETVAREWIAARFPNDAILGEEFGETPGTSGRRWLIDPVDGTKTFIRGVPLWGSLIAVVEGDRVLAGAAAFPAVNELLAAAPGEGCWHDGRRARVSDVATLADATVLTTDIGATDPPERQAEIERLARCAAIARTWGDCYGYLLVATGRAEAMLDARMNDWDSAALLPIIEEAGGVFTDWDGRVTGLGGSSIATNKALAREVRIILATS
jgi:histidinol phosphatase-like enzyme (inositol monophosphatase family)